MRRLLLSWMLLCFVHCSAGADDRVSAYLIRLPSSVDTVFVAETTAAAFHRFENTQELELEYGGAAYMSIGENGDGKQRNGDRRTPLGIYFVTEQLDTSKLHEKYGLTAFTLDYPNALDSRRKRTGGGIWVHGVDRRGGKRPPRDTDGCIALPNETLKMLEHQFLPNVTPVVIAREVNWIEQDEIDELRAELDAVVAHWAASLQRGDTHAYLSLYDDDFRHWGMNKSEWIAFSAETLASRPIQKVEISDVLLLGDPEENGVYLSRFRLAVTEGANTVALTKRLYWRRYENGTLTIVAEDSG
jgi:murein L,D-transpeptidase YafK